MSRSPLARSASLRLALTLVLISTAASACRRQDVPAPAGAPARRDAGADLRAAAPGPGLDAAQALAPAKKIERRALPANLPQGQEVVVLHSANLRGEYDFHPLGGLGRRATLVAETAQRVRALVQVDAGDSLLPRIAPAPGEPPPDRGEVVRRARLLATGLGRLNLDGFVPGETDLQLGAQLLRQLAKQHRLPVLAANLVDRKGKRLFDSHRLVTVDGVQVGLFGVLSVADEETPKLAALKLALTDIQAAAQGATSVLREAGAQIVVGLAHLGGGLAEARALAANSTGVDVIVLGHDPQLLEEPVIVGDGAAEGTYIVAAGERGRFLGRVALHLVDGDSGFAAARTLTGAVKGSWLDHELVRLDPRFVTDPAMSALIAPYIAETRRRTARKIPVGLTARAGTHGEVADSSQENWSYATTSACGLCHSMQKEQFDTTSHAFALATLERKGRERDPYCLGCHSTGFDVPGGTKNLQTAVQYFGPTGCESCHGPSVVHVRKQSKVGTSLKVPEAVCLRCHRNEHSPEPFDYAAALKEILGPGHGVAGP